MWAIGCCGLSAGSGCSRSAFTRSATLVCPTFNLSREVDTKLNDSTVSWTFPIVALAGSKRVKHAIPGDFDREGKHSKGDDGSPLGLREPLLQGKKWTTPFAGIPILRFGRALAGHQNAVAVRRRTL